MATIDELNARRDEINEQITALVDEKKAIAMQISDMLLAERAEEMMRSMSPGQINAFAHAAPAFLTAQAKDVSNGQ